MRLSSVDLGQADTLDDGERQRAASLGSGIQRDRFLAGRIALRRHAAETAGMGAAGLRADYICRECRRGDRVHGMPRYQAGPSGPAVLASLSRAGDWCLLAATTDERVLGVGVDLEGSTAAGFDGFGLVALSEREREHLQRVEPALRPRFQTLLWTRKEAVLKALGRGLAAVDPALVDVAGPVPLLPGFLQAPAPPLVTGVPLAGGQEGSGQRWLVDAVDPESVGLPHSFMVAIALARTPGP
ncbi:4'-phosphopantetheinyl transferase family protein [Arthrobacter globiformis]|uniref:4-phosphopantetheinyl transferase n=1 Tax=Arthrobacter globiformis TaxID=1665 RepID=A0A328HKJ9_ARTGO|nr:4'-phosphopantetheinyl transferase superfamily protein [Arthrobacter globiformis]RAM38691.1 4-phosphopantetheinyl transferase [Arthrobacter globiformis]